MTKKITALLLALSLLITMAACAQTPEGEGDSSSTSQVTSTSPDDLQARIEQELRTQMQGLTAESWSDLTTEQWLEDWDYLYAALKDNYPYFGVVERTTGMNMEERYQEIRARIPGYKSDAEFFLDLYDFVGETGNAGHFSLSWPTPDVEAGAYYTGLYNMVIPMLIEAEERYAAELGYSGDSANVSTRILEEGSIAYAKIDSFGMGYYAEDKDILLDFYRQVADYDHLIIDITENGGGGMDYYWDLIMAPNIDNFLYCLTYSFIKEGELNRNHLANRGMTFENSYISTGKVPADYLTEQNLDELRQFLPEDVAEELAQRVRELPWPPEHMNADDLADLNYYSPGLVYVGPSFEQKLFQGEIWVLVSDEVYSSSESFAVFCKDSGFATLVGTRTGGDGIGMDPVVFQLPNTGIYLRYAPIYGTTLDGRSSEEWGTLPDVLSREGETALEACLREIRGE